MKFLADLSLNAIGLICAAGLLLLVLSAWLINSTAYEMLGFIPLLLGMATMFAGLALLALRIINRAVGDDG